MCIFEIFSFAIYFISMVFVLRIAVNIRTFHPNIVMVLFFVSLIPIVNTLVFILVAFIQKDNMISRFLDYSSHRNYLDFKDFSKIVYLRPENWFVKGNKMIYFSDKEAQYIEVPFKNYFNFCKAVKALNEAKILYNDGTTKNNIDMVLEDSVMDNSIEEIV